MSEASNSTVSVLTPAGRGAVATIVVTGSGALSAVETYFRTAGQRLSCRTSGEVAYGRWASDRGEEIVAVQRNDTVELHCHGGVAASEMIVRDLEKLGSTRATWQAFELGRLEHIQAEAAIALSNAATLRTASILLDQYHGALHDEVMQLLQLIEKEDLQEAQARLQGLCARSRVGLHLVQPWRVVLAGSPNVGKSSLINRLLGYERSIVFDQPGTTRDVVRALTAIDGWPVELTDTAGLRTSTDALEAEGVQRARQQLEQADAVVLVFDASATPSECDELLHGNWPNAIVVHNKIDAAKERPKTPGHIHTSAITGEGIEVLLKQLSVRLVPEPPPPGSAVPFTGLLAQRIAEASQLLATRNSTAASKCLRECLDGR